MNPLVFNVKFTEARPTANWDSSRKAKWREERSFYSLSGDKNHLRYTSTEAKVFDEQEQKKIGYLGYSDKGLGVFDLDGFIDQEKADKLMQSAQKNKGTIWHGVVSFSPEDRELIDRPEKAFDFIKKTFPTYLKNCGFKTENLDMFFGLHLDRNHAHIHFQYWENKPVFRKAQTGELTYRTKPTTPTKVIENYKVSAGMYFADGGAELGAARDEAVKTLKGSHLASKQEIGRMLLELADRLPKDGRLSYNSSNMKDYRGEVDKIVEACKSYSPELKEADLKFRLEYEKRRKEAMRLATKKSGEQTLPEQDIDYLNKIKDDYNARLGNAVIRLASFTKKATERDKLKEVKGYRPTAKFNDKHRKSRSSATLHMVSKNVDLMLKDMIAITGKDDFTFDLIKAKWEIAQSKKDPNDNWVDEHKS